jgi:hypothetical protein
LRKGVNWAEWGRFSILNFNFDVVLRSVRSKDLYFFITKDVSTRMVFLGQKGLDAVEGGSVRAADSPWGDPWGEIAPMLEKPSGEGWRIPHAATSGMLKNAATSTTRMSGGWEAERSLEAIPRSESEWGDDEDLEWLRSDECVESTWGDRDPEGSRSNECESRSELLALAEVSEASPTEESEPQHENERVSSNQLTAGLCHRSQSKPRMRLWGMRAIPKDLCSLCEEIDKWVRTPCVTVSDVEPL